MDRINPRLPSGFRDYLPKEMIPRQKMLNTIRSVFELFGFVPLETPGVEKEEILIGGDPNFNKEIFKLSTREGKEKDVALRFDLTVPLARVIAQYPNEIKKPFKRYQIGTVWRGEKPQAGRYREFIQYDVDIVGSSSMMADAEIIAIIYETMTALGLKKFLIRVNNRKILNGLAELIGFEQKKIASVLRSIDKLDKQGWRAVSSELAEEEKKGGVGLFKNQINALKNFFEIQSGNQEKVLELVSNIADGVPIIMGGAEELRQVAENLRALGIPDNKWVIDLSVARGLGYYTGPVFETILTDLPGFGSVCSGGRYDGLVERFSSVSVPATGVSLGVDRLFVAMEELNLLEKRKTLSQVIVLNFDSSCEVYIQEITTEIRRAGIRTEIYLGTESTIKGQLAYALNAEIPVILIVGSEERKKNTVQIKNVGTREQKEVVRSEIFAKIMEVLNS